MKSMTATDRQELVLQGQRLEYFTLVSNSLEAVVSIVAGLIAGSVALTTAWLVLNNHVDLPFHCKKLAAFGRLRMFNYCLGQLLD